MENESPLLIFVHIPRAGGSSMWRILRQVYGRRMKRVVGHGLERTYDEVRDLALERADAYDVIGGHVPFGIARGSPRPVRYITVLRDPTDLVLSRYFKRSRPEVQARKKMRRGEAGAVGLAAPGSEERLVDIVSGQRANPMTKVLCSAHQPRRQPNLKVTRAHLAEAKENLERHFAAVAFVERYADSVAAMAERLGWSAVPQVEARNRGVGRPKGYPAEIYEVGRRVHALDYELYDFAGKLFESRAVC